MRFDLNSYETVEERLEKFWSEHPNGRIETRLLSDPNALDEVVVWAGVWFDVTEEHPRGTGLAFERRGGQGANQTSHLENCETSSIGRALANAGFKAKRDAPRPSREEMRKANEPPRSGSLPAARPESRGDQAATRTPAQQKTQEAVEKAERPLQVTPGVEDTQGGPCTLCNADVPPRVAFAARQHFGGKILCVECGKMQRQKTAGNLLEAETPEPGSGFGRD